MTDIDQHRKTMFGILKGQLQTLKSRTGYNQFETLMQEPDWRDKANQLLNLMVNECVRPPYDRIRPEVKSRILIDAQLTDKDFTGMNARWVRRILDKWWDVYGSRILQAENGHAKGVTVIHRTAQETQKIDNLINSFLKDLQQIPEPARRVGEHRREFLKLPEAQPVEPIEHNQELIQFHRDQFMYEHPEATADEVMEHLHKLNLI